MTPDALRVGTVHTLQLSQRSGLLERAEDKRGDTEGENDNENEGETEEDRVDGHPDILDETVPELEGVLDGLQIEEESTPRSSTLRRVQWE